MLDGTAVENGERLEVRGERLAVRGLKIMNYELGIMRAKGVNLFALFLFLQRT